MRARDPNPTAWSLNKENLMRPVVLLFFRRREVLQGRLMQVMPCHVMVVKAGWMS